MYLAFRFHHMKPSEFYEMGYGERVVLRAFLHYEVEQRNHEAESLKEGK